MSIHTYPLKNAVPATPVRHDDPIDSYFAPLPRKTAEKPAQTQRETSPLDQMFAYFAQD